MTAYFALKALTDIPCFRPLTTSHGIAGTSRRLINAVARRSWLSGPTHSSARTGLAEAPVRGHSCTASHVPSTGGVKTPAPGVLQLPGGPHPLATDRLRDPDRRDRCGARKGCTASLIRGGRPVRPFRLALHIAPSARSAGLRTLASRLLAYLGCAGLGRRRVRRGRLAHRQLVWRRNAVHAGDLQHGREMVWRIGSLCELERSYRALTRGRSDLGGLLHCLASWFVGGLAADIESVRVAVIL